MFQGDFLDPLSLKMCFAVENLKTYPFSIIQLLSYSSVSTSSLSCFQELSSGCVFRDFLRGINPRSMKHHQWAVFARSHAKQIIKYAKVALETYQEVWTQAAPDIKGGAEGCSDEAVPLIALLKGLELEKKSTGNTWTDLTRLGVEQNCLTYVRWRNCFIGTDLALRDIKGDITALWRNRYGIKDIVGGNQAAIQQSALKKELNGFPHSFESITSDYLRIMVNQGFMFARKMDPKVSVTSGRLSYADFLWLPFASYDEPQEPQKQSLEVLLPELWSKVNVSGATWSRLDVSGKPGPLNQPMEQ